MNRSRLSTLRLLLIALTVVALALTIFLATPSSAQEEAIMEDERLDQLLTSSQTEKRGLVFFVQGATVAGRVTSFDAETVEATSQSYERIILRRDRIDGVAIQ